MALDWLTYLNQGATRNQPLSPQLVNDLSFLPDMGVSMKVFSGGQDATGPRRTGSHRHDNGNAADVFFYKDGRQLDWANPQDLPVFEDIVKQGKAAGITGFGAGPGYMRPGSMHIGLGSPAVWGAGGSGSNAPDWLRAAYNGTAAQAPQQVAQAAPDGPKGQEVYPAPTQVAQAPQHQGLLSRLTGGKVQPPQGLMQLMTGNSGQQAGNSGQQAGGGLLGALAAMQPQEAPQIQPMQAPQGPTLADYLQQFMQSRMA